MRVPRVACGLRWTGGTACGGVAADLQALLIGSGPNAFHDNHWRCRPSRPPKTPASGGGPGSGMRVGLPYVQLPVRGSRIRCRSSTRVTLLAGVLKSPEVVVAYLLSARS
jgi:hypothetical protein